MIRFFFNVYLACVLRGCVEMAVGCGMKCIKFLIFFFNFLFLVSWFAFLSSWILSHFVLLFATIFLTRSFYFPYILDRCKSPEFSHIR